MKKSTSALVSSIVSTDSKIFEAFKLIDGNFSDIDGQLAAIRTLLAAPITELRIAGPKGSYASFGWRAEEITLSTAGLTTDSVSDLLVGNGINIGVVARVVQTISGGGVASVQLGDATTANRFAVLTPLTEGIITYGTRHWDTAINAALTGPRQTNVAKLRATAVGGIPTQGKIFVVVFHMTMSAPTT